MAQQDESIEGLRAALAEAYRRVSELEEGQEALKAQNEELLVALRALSTPLIPITDHVLAMPLVGILDDERLLQVMEVLLTGIAGRRARVAILDITGVSEVDGRAAAGLISAARAARLLGVEVMLTGISPEVAQVLVQLDIPLGELDTHATLQSGIAAAMGQRGARGARGAQEADDRGRAARPATARR